MSKKIGFDIHGVIDRNPSLFSMIINEFRGLGYEVHILTGSLLSPMLVRELEKLGIKYDRLFSILSHHRENGTEMWENEDGWWVDDNIWVETKGIYCEKHNIDFHIDDSKIYGKYFNTPFAHITPEENGYPRLLEISGNVDTEILDILKKYEGYYKMRF